MLDRLDRVAVVRATDPPGAAVAVSNSLKSSCQTWFGDGAAEEDPFWNDREESSSG
jgi:hypothetical protein